MGTAFILILAPTIMLTFWTLNWGLNRWVDAHTQMYAKRRRRRNR